MKKIGKLLGKIMIALTLVISSCICFLWLRLEYILYVWPFEPGIYQMNSYDSSKDEEIFSRVVITPISEEVYQSYQGNNVVEDYSKNRSNKYYHIHVILIIDGKEKIIFFENLKYSKQGPRNTYYDEKNNQSISVFRNNSGYYRYEGKNIVFD